MFTTNKNRAFNTGKTQDVDIDAFVQLGVSSASKAAQLPKLQLPITQDMLSSSSNLLPEHTHIMVKQRSMSDSSPRLNTSEMDIDTLLSMATVGNPGAETVGGGSLNKLDQQSRSYSPKPSKLQHSTSFNSLLVSKSRQFGSNASLERTSHVVKTRFKPSRLSTSKPILPEDVVRPEREFVVEQDRQDIDMFLKVSKFHQTTELEKQEAHKKHHAKEEMETEALQQMPNQNQDENRRQSVISNNQSIVSNSSDGTTTNYSTTGNTSMVSETLPLTNHAKGSRKHRKTLVYRTGENCPLTIPSYQTDIDCLLDDRTVGANGSLPRMKKSVSTESPDYLRYLKDTHQSKCRTRSQLEDIDIRRHPPAFPRAEIKPKAPIRTRTQRAYTFTFNTPFLNSKEDKISSWEKIRKFHSAILLDRVSRLETQDSDIDMILGISKSFENEENIGVSIRNVDVKERPRTGQIDADFIFQVSDKSLNGSKDYRSIISQPEYQVDPFITVLNASGEAKPQDFDGAMSQESNQRRGKENTGNSLKNEELGDNYYKGSKSIQTVTDVRHWQKTDDIDQYLKQGEDMGKKFPSLLQVKQMQIKRGRAISELPFQWRASSDPAVVHHVQNKSQVQDKKKENQSHGKSQEQRRVDDYKEDVLPNTKSMGNLPKSPQITTK